MREQEKEEEQANESRVSDDGGSERELTEKDPRRMLSERDGDVLLW